MRLSLLHQTQRAQLDALAQAWLDQGATALSLWADEQLIAHWPADVLPSRSALHAPIDVAGQRVGELYVAGVEHAAAQRRLTADAALVARLIELETEMEGMTSELIDVQDQLLALYDLTQSTRGHFDLRALLDVVVREAARLLRVEGAFAVIDQSAGPLFVVQHGASMLEHAVTAQLFGQLQARGRELLIVDAAAASLPANIQNMFVAPIRIKDETATVQGALGLWNKQHSFNSPDLKLIRTIAEQAGAQIENVLLHQATVARAKLQTEMDLARAVQLRLLPQSAPNAPGVDVWAHSRPALEVGGDFYDLVCESRRPFVFSVGDVSGKGMSAALLMAMTRTVLRGAARFTPDPLPKILMDRLNEDLYEDFTEVSMFATVFVGRFDQRQLHYCNAGHSPVLYRPADSTARLLEADGPPIGVMPINLWDHQQLPLGPGDLLVVATDGLSEAVSSAGELFGYERLTSLIDAVASGTAAEIGQALLSAVQQFSSGQAQSDDQTVLVIKGV